MAAAAFTYKTIDCCRQSIQVSRRCHFCVHSLVCFTPLFGCCCVHLRPPDASSAERLPQCKDSAHPIEEPAFGLHLQCAAEHARTVGRQTLAWRGMAISFRMPSTAAGFGGWPEPRRRVHSRLSSVRSAAASCKFTKNSTAAALPITAQHQKPVLLHKGACGDLVCRLPPTSHSRAGTVPAEEAGPQPLALQAASRVPQLQGANRGRDGVDTTEHPCSVPDNSRTAGSGLDNLLDRRLARLCEVATRSVHVQVRKHLDADEVVVKLHLLQK